MGWELCDSLPPSCQPVLAGVRGDLGGGDISTAKGLPSSKNLWRKRASYYSSSLSSEHCKQELDGLTATGQLSCQTQNMITLNTALNTVTDSTQSTSFSPHWIFVSHHIRTDSWYYSTYAISKNIEASFCIRQSAFTRRKKPAWEDYSLGKTVRDHASQEPLQ
jgi:hypothetical protein